MTSWTLLKVFAAAPVLIGLHPALGQEREPREWGIFVSEMRAAKLGSMFLVGW
jgi:hypothetical protein